jgi:hypothetical protein
MDFLPDATQRKLLITKTYAQDFAVSAVAKWKTASVGDSGQIVAYESSWTFSLGRGPLDYFRLICGSTPQSTILNNNNYNVISGYGNGAASVIYVNAASSTVNAGTGNADDPTFGKSWNGYGSEIIWLDNNANLATLRANQGSYYGITV